MDKVDTQYDLSVRDRELVQKRAALRASLRAEFLKKFADPHRHGEGGYIFDPATQRWLSMRANHWHWFKPTPKTAWPAFGVIFSCLAYGHWLRTRREAREHQIRTGNYAYRDRPFKFV